MTNEEQRDLCLALLKAEDENSVVAVLTEAGLWDRPDCWRLYGDRDGNYAIIGNQQSRPDAALAEKIINSVDARLMNECLVRGVDPTSAAAPKSIRHAIGRYFEERQPASEDMGGELQEWTPEKRLKEARAITVAATGKKSRPCLTIADCGEGQTPEQMPNTFLSIDKENKLRIPFVQGKFNMGGTGALKFCGNHSLQLIISRRNPAIPFTHGATDVSASQWGFTVVRREKPRAAAGSVRNSVFRYLAPHATAEGNARGGVLRFTADTLTIFPSKNRAYVRDSEWGSLVKLFDYDMKGFASHILMKDGLLYRLEALLPGIALPVRMHECRDYRGKSQASFATNLIGLTNRLEVNRGGNIEDGYPTSVPLTVRGEHMTARIYAFQRGKAETYRTNEGAIFTINGQTHGAIPKTIFARRNVNMGRLGDSLLLTVDCSAISVGAREDLFMNSRDRLSNGTLRKAIENALEDVLKKHPGLRELRELRSSRAIAERLADAKPLRQVLASILRSSPSLSALLLTGQRLGNPHKPGDSAQEDTEGGDGPDPAPTRYDGKVHPTIFKFEGRKYGEELTRNCEIGRRCRLRFETDVANDYFSRSKNAGTYSVRVLASESEGAPGVNSSLTLHNGFGHWSIELPDEAAVGDELVVECTVTDDVLLDPFVNVARLRVRGKSDRPGSSGGRRRSKSGRGRGGFKGRSKTPTEGLQDPPVLKVRREQWAEHGFDKFSACRIVRDVVETSDGEHPYPTFYVNVDNLHLRTDMKGSKRDPRVVEDVFVYGNVLLGLSLFQAEMGSGEVSSAADSTDGDEEAPSLEEKVQEVTRAFAPFLVPMINHLGSLSLEDEDEPLGEIGDNE